MNLSIISRLKQKLITAKDLGSVWEYFWDYIDEHPDFMQLGSPARHRFLEKVLREIGRKAFDKRVRLTKPMLIRLPKYRFIHGSCQLNGHLASVLFFEELQMGLVAIVISDYPGETQIVRFTSLKAENQNRWSFSLN